MVYLISYDLYRPAQDYEGLISDIKSIGPWAKMLKSAWLVDSKLTASQIYDHVVKHLDKNDRIMVNEFTSNHRGYLNQDIVDWLKAYF